MAFPDGKRRTITRSAVSSQNAWIIMYGEFMLPIYLSLRDSGQVNSVYYQQVFVRGGKHTDAAILGTTAHAFKGRAVQICDGKITITTCEAFALETPTPNGRQSVSNQKTCQRRTIYDRKFIVYLILNTERGTLGKFPQSQIYGADNLFLGQVRRVGSRTWRTNLVCQFQEESFFQLSPAFRLP